MDLIAILSTVILLVTVGTIVVALAAYAAVKVRDKRKPKPGRGAQTVGSTGFQPEFLQRYMPPAAGADPATPERVDHTSAGH